MLKRLRAIVMSVLLFPLLITAPTANALAECTKSSTYQSGYVYVAFKDSSASCTWTVPSDAVNIDYALIAGGGSGGSRHAGGGGAGGMLTGTNVSLTGITSLNITVGAGGASVIPGGLNYAVGLAGGNSTIAKNAGSGNFNMVTAIGGGGGEAGGAGAQNGGSGGGTQYPHVSTGTAGQGNAGGGGASDSSSWWSSGGGGGAGVGAVGVNGSAAGGGAGGAGSIWLSAFTTTTATALGLTQTNQTSGNQVYFAGGGGGSSTGTAGGNGGLGGGGKGVLGNATADSGTTNSGGGGGGSGCCNGGNSGAGGSGVLLLRYAANAGLAISVSSPAIYRTVTSIVATANIDGKVSFYANGRIIPNCRRLSTSSKSVTCNWKPSVHGASVITASISSLTFADYTGSARTTATAVKRSGTR